MSTYKKFLNSMSLTMLLSFGIVAGIFAQDTTSIVKPDLSAPVILATSPASGEMNVDLNSVIEITFSHDMDEISINETTLLFQATYADTMHEAYNEGMMYDQKERSAIKDSKNNWNYTTSAVNGTITYSNRVAVFTPDMELKEDTQYTFTVTNGVRSSDNAALKNDHKWSFTTENAPDSTIKSEDQALKYGQVNYEYSTDNEYNTTDKYSTSAYSTSNTDTTIIGKTSMIDLGKAGDFVILAKESVNKESDSKITGQIGEGSEVEFEEESKEDNIYVVDSDSVQQVISDQVAFQSNQNDSTTSDVNEALEDMMIAFKDASEMNANELTTTENESFQSVLLTSGVHVWSDTLQIDSDVTLSGSANDVWLIKVSNNLIVDDNVVFTLTNGALADNVFWYVEGEVIIGENAQFEGIILSMNEITLEKGAKLNGRMYSQTSITLDENTVVEPSTMDVRTTSKNK